MSNRKIAALLLASGAALIVLVFVLAVQAALSYQKPQIGGDAGAAFSSMLSEVLYLFGKAVFLFVAILAASHLLKNGVELLKSEGFMQP
ncbi:hypothetical protein [Thermofilum pendens]|uniref:Uncharacterized protein n=1 Tax=Thermofilum pendens (strain DSM 2475 / Hrk 5) TaxID=368408 RepID=A1RZI4_THEPD|nr:hypothetical protein [Thermofilum pendens]ABL78614.1 hypothetical protein Tpen_1216 [Thermofilum pendens Hrk 5]